MMVPAPFWAGDAEAPAGTPSSLLLKFDSGLLVDQNSTRTNTLTANGSPTAVTTDKKWGTHSAHFDTTSNENIDVESPSDFRTSGQEATLDFWFNPTTAGAQIFGSVMRDTLMALATAAPVTQSPAGGNVVGYFWWSPSNGGTFGFQNGATVTGVTSGAWHHCRLCWYADNQMNMYLDGSRFGFTNVGAASFDVISIGNQRTANEQLDGSAASFVWQGFIDSVRMITGTALEPKAATTMTVPTEDFPNI